MKPTLKYTLAIACLAGFLNACGGDDDDNQNNNQNNIVENTKDLCSDNLDNDNNGLSDCKDPGCSAFAFCQAAEEGKENTLAACMDDTDNDGDGAKDCDDTECKAFAICQESQAENTLAACQDGRDNDKDGQIDCNDPECQSFNVCNTGTNPGETEDKKTENSPNDCLDGEDNDGDGKTDCCDDGCKIFAFCADMCADDKPETPAEASLAECTDGEDNDKDGAVDCLDEGCRGFEICADLVGVQENTRELCSDEIDNDYNGKADADDDNCRLFYAAGGQYGENTVAKCTDKKDNDGDGVTDCDDPECQEYDFCQKGYSESGDDCKDDPFTFKKQGSCTCGQTLVGTTCYNNITEPKDFDKLKDSKDKFILKQNIDFGETQRAPILGFKGVLDGNNKRITGVFTQKPVAEPNANHRTLCGLFGDSGTDNTKAVVFKNIDLAITLNCYNDCTDNTQKLKSLYAGGLSARLLGSAENIQGSSKVYVEDLYNSTVSGGKLPSYSFQNQSLYKSYGGLFGHFEDGHLSHITLSGNVSAYMPIQTIDWFKSKDANGKEVTDDNNLIVRIGGVAGMCNELHDVHADNYSTLKRSDVTRTHAYYYYGGICGIIDWTPENSTDIYAAENVSSRSVIKYLPTATNSSSGASFIGGVTGYVASGGIIKDAVFQGVIETNKIKSEYVTSTNYGQNIGGIAGSMTCSGDICNTRTTGIDGCHTDATFRVLGEYSSIGGIIGRMTTNKSFVRNSSSNIDLELKNINTSASYIGAYGGIMGSTTFNKKEYDKQVYIINNSARTNYDQTLPFDASNANLGGIVGNGGGVVVNNFASDTLKCVDACKYVPKAIGGGYVYEAYWNKDIMGTDSGAAEYSDASAEPYTYNAAGIPVTKSAKTVLGLLRYNSGHDGGVLSAHIPANIGGIYNTWITVNDNDGHEIPVPADK